MHHVGWVALGGAPVHWTGSRLLRRFGLDGTPVEPDVNDRPTGNVVQRESWVELRPRYPVPSRRGTRTRYTLYRAIRERFDDHPEREKFPASRNR